MIYIYLTRFISYSILFLNSHVVNFSISLYSYFLVGCMCKLYSGFYLSELTVVASLLTYLIMFVFIKLLARFFYFLYFFDFFSVKLEEWSGLSKKGYWSKEYTLRRVLNSKAGWGTYLLSCFQSFLSLNINKISPVFNIISSIIFINGVLLVVPFHDWVLLKLWLCVVFGFKSIAMLIQLGYSSDYYSKLFYEKTGLTGHDFSHVPRCYVRGKLVLSFEDFSFNIGRYFLLLSFGPLLHTLIFYLLYSFGYASDSFLQFLFSFF